MAIKPKKLPAGSFLRAFAGIVPPAALAMALSACSLVRVAGNDPQIVSYEYRPQFGFVRIERIEAGAPDNAHPFSISADALRQTLANLKVEGSISMSAEPIFTDKELEEIVPHLVAALAKAGPKEDVTFAVTGKHGFFGAYSSKSVTTGRLFVRDRELNIIFRLMHELYEGGELGGGGPSFAGTPPFPPGSRAYRSDEVWRVVPESGHLVDRRSDWVMLDTTTLPAPKEKTVGARAATPAAPATDSRYQEIESRLNALNRLKANGLITEEEYSERRRAILQGL
jgi:putative oligomerization/nucleic acid binding protein